MSVAWAYAAMNSTDLNGTAKPRIANEWQMRPTHADNHFFDCLVGCAVAASEQGVVLPGTGGTLAKKKPPIKLSALRGRKSC
jgi:hypothetical protein